MPDKTTTIPVGQKYYCKLLFNGIEYNALNVVSIVIVEWVFEFLPKVEIILKYDPSYFEQFPIQDNDEISINLSNKEDNLNMFHMDCQIQDFKINTVSDDRANVIQITGFLKTKNLWDVKSKSYSFKNSEKVLQQVCTDIGLRFDNPLNIKPSDKMTWYQIVQNNFDFIKHVLKRANISNDCLFFYANHKGECIYTSLNKEINKTEGKFAKFSIDNFEQWTPPEKDETIWYNSYDITNLQGTYNKESNYGGAVGYYDTITEKVAKFSDFEKMADLTFIDKKYKGKTVFGMYGGTYNLRTMYGKSGDYFESYIRNYFLKNTLLGLSLQLNINPVIDVNLFDNVKLKMDSKLPESPKITTGEEKEKTLASNNIISGNYLITGIRYSVVDGGTFQKIIFLSRNGMNFPDNKQFTAWNAG